MSFSFVIFFSCSGKIKVEGTKNRATDQKEKTLTQGPSSIHVALPPGAIKGKGSLSVVAGQMAIPYGATAVSSPVSIGVLDSTGAILAPGYLLKDLAIKIKTSGVFGLFSNPDAAIYVIENPGLKYEKRFFITDLTVNGGDVSFNLRITNAALVLVDVSNVKFTPDFPALPSRDKPAVTIDAAAASTLASDGKEYVSALNLAAFKLSGTCSQDGQMVTISSPATVQIPCAKGLWSLALDLSNAADGAVTFNADFKDSDGNVAVQKKRLAIIDQSAPVFSSVLLANEASDGNIIDSEKAATSDVIGLVTATGYDSIGYKITASTNSCAGPLSYENTVPKISSSDLSSDGDFKVCLRLADLAGNVTYGESSQIHRETTVPTVVAGSDVTAAVQETLTGTSSKTGTYLWTKESGSGSITFGSATALSTTVSASADDTYVLKLTVTDAVGNIGSSTMNLVWSTSGPTFTSLALLNGAADQYLNASENSANTAIAGNLVAALYTTATYKLVTAATTCSGAGGYSGTIPTANSSDFAGAGSYKVCVKLTDASSNVTYGATSNFTLDTTAATVGAGSNQTKNASFTQTATSSEAGTYLWSQTSGPGALTFGSQTALSSTISASADGTYVVRLTSTDAAGNAAYSEFTLIWDTTGPTAPTFTSATPTSPSTSSTTPAIVGSSAADTATVTLYSDVSCSTQIGTGTKSSFEGAGLTASATANATTTIYAKAFDATGNSSACTSLTSYLHDNTAPAAPAYTSSTPTSPSNSSTTPSVVGTSSADTVTVKLYDGNTCANQIGTGTKSAFEGAGLSATVTANGTTTIYATSFDAAGNASSCTSLASYIHDNVAPAAPGYTSLTPTSPSNSSTTPAVVGTSSADTATVKLYDSNSCATQIGTGTKASFEGAGLTATVASNTTTAIYAKSFDDSGNASACTSMASYIHDNAAPTAPGFSSTSPASPSSVSTTPLVIGTSSADSDTVKLYSNNTCATQIGTGSKATFESTGLTATVTADATTTIYAKSFDIAGNSSACTSFTSYVHDSSAPGGLAFTSTTPASPSTSSTTPVVIGTASSDTVTVKLYDSNACTNQIGTGSKAAFEGAGITATVSANTTTTIYGTATNGVGTASACALLTTYIHDNTAPTAPGFASTSPASPAGSTTTPAVIGTSSADTATVKFYDGNTCANQIGTGSKSSFEGAGIAATVTANDTTTIYAKSFDTAGNASACTSMVSFVHDNVAPTAPSFGSTNPSSPSSSSFAPNVIGSASADTVTVNLYSNNTCTTLLVSGTKADFEGAGLAVTATANGTMTIYGKDVDAAGNSSGCATLTSYVHDAVAPTAPSFSSVSPTSPGTSSTPAVIGSSSADTVTVKLYSNNTCTTEIGTGTKSTFEGAGIAATVATNTATVIYAKTFDSTGNGSTCTTMTTYTHDNTAPTAPTPAGTALVNTATPTWTWTAGTGGSGTFRYKLDSSDLSTGATETTSFSYTPVSAISEASHTLYVQERDTAGNWSTSGSFALTVDLTAPTVSGVSSSTNDGSFTIGGSVSIQVTFSEAVTVTGTPQLTLETGTTDRAVNYASGSGTTALTFTYTVQAGDTSSDLDYTSTSALALNSGTIKDAAGTNANLALAAPAAAGSLAHSKALVIDTTAPTAPSVTGTTPTSDTTPTWSWTPGGGGDGNYRYKLNDSDLTSGATTTTSTSYTPGSDLADGTHTLHVQEKDAVGNWSTSGTFDVVISSAALNAPSVTSAAATTNSTTPTWTWTAGGGGNGTFRYKLDDTDLTTGSTQTTSTTFTPGSALLAAAHTLYVQERNAGGTWSSSGSYAVTIDTTAPTVSSVNSSTADGTVSSGNISILVNFSETVTVTGTPQLTLETGTTDRTVNYASGSGTTALTFTYTVQAGDASSDLDYVSTSALALNSGTIKDAAGNDATLTLAAPGAANSLGANKALVINTDVPTVASVTSNTANATYGMGTVVDVRVTFSATVNVTGTPQMTMATGGTSRTANYASGTGSTVLVFNYTIGANDTSSDLDYASTSALALNGGTIKDGASFDATLTLPATGSGSSLGGSKAIVVAATTPGTFTITGPAAYVTSTTPSVTWGASTGATKYDLKVDNDSDCSSPSQTYSNITGTSKALTAITAGTYYVCMTAKDNSTNYINATNYGYTFTMDNVAPTVTGVTSNTADGTYSNADVIDVLVTFSEAVTVTGTPTLQLETGTTDQILNYVSGSGTTTLRFDYTVQAGDTSADLNYKATTSLALAGGTIKDAAANNATLTLPALAGATALKGSKALVIDTAVPVVSSVNSNTTNGTYKAGTVIDLRVTFNKSVTVTGTPQITLETGTTDQAVNYTSGSGSTVLVFEYTVQAGDTSADLTYVATTSLALNGGTIKATVTAQDATLTLASPAAAGSLGANKALVIDTTPPGAFSITAPTTPTTDTTPAITWGASTGALNYDIAVSANSNCSSPVQSYTAATGTSKTLTAITQGTYYVCMTAKDTAGNTTAATNDAYTFYLDTPATVLNVSASTADGTIYQGGTVDVTVQFSEVITVTGTPRITMASGGSAAYANYSSGTGTDTLTFTYTVAQGHTNTDFDYSATTSLALNSGTLKDPGNYAATLTLPAPGAAGSLSANKNIVVLGNPGAFTMNNIISGSSYAEVTWIASATAVTYTVQRGTTTGVYPTTVGSTSSQSFADTGMANGSTYYYMVTATNASGSTNATAQKTVIPAIFTADAGPDTSGGGTVTLYGNDPNGVSSRLWAKVSGPGSLTFGTSTTASTTVTASTDGSYVISYTLTDTNGNNASDQMTLTWFSGTPSFTSIDLIGVAANGVVNSIERRSGEYIVGNLVGSDYTKANYYLTPSSMTCSSVGRLLYLITKPVVRDLYYLADGSYKVCVRLDHLNGNSAYGSSADFSFDKTTPVAESHTVLSAAVGGTHTCVILDDHTVKCWGKGSNGQLGYDSSASQGKTAGSLGSLPIVNLGAGRTAKGLAAGDDHTCAILDDDNLKCWGHNYYGQLGYNDTTDRGLVGGASSMALLSHVNLGAGRTAWSIAASASSTCAILDDHSLKCWGYNGSGQLGYDDTTQRLMPATPAVNLGTGRTAIRVALNNSTTCAILDNGDLKCWGSNATLRLDSAAGVNVGWTAGSMASLSAMNLGAGRSAKEVSVGHSHACAILDDDSVKCWGNVNNGALGQDSGGGIAGSSIGSYAPINLGTGRSALSLTAFSGSTCAVLDNNTVKCWGDNSNGQLGYDDNQKRGHTTGSMAALATVNLGVGRTAQKIIAGSHQSTSVCVILDNNTLTCWGSNSEGQLGYDDPYHRGIATYSSMTTLPSINLGTGRSAKIVAPSSSHTCAILDDDSLRCWGANNNGQLGLDHTIARGGTAGSMATLPPVNLGINRTAKFVATGAYEATCAILDDNSLKCWGQNSWGQLGYDDADYRGNSPGSMAALSTINLGTGRTAKQVTMASGNANGYFACAILDNDTVKCWGDNTNGELGIDSTVRKGDSAGEMASLTGVYLGAGRTAKELSSGDNHNCVILDNGGVKCWGYNAHGQLGMDDTANRGDSGGDMAALTTVNLGVGRKATKILARGNRSCALLDNAKVKCWGSDTQGDTGIGSGYGSYSGSMAFLVNAINLGTGRTATAIAGGYSSTCALLDDHSVKCFGNNVYGELGQNSIIATGPQSVSTIGTMSPINFGDNKEVTAIFGGNYTNCAIFSDNSLKCWGTNDSGQLGYDDKANRGSGLSMSDAIPIYFP